MFEKLESRRLFASAATAGVVGDVLTVTGGSKSIENVVIGEQLGGTTTVTVNGSLLYTGQANVDFKHVAVFSKGGGNERVDATLNDVDLFVTMGGGNDQINIGGHGAASVDGQGGKDVITVQYGNGDNILGGDGDDNITLTEENGGSLVDGGKGKDTITIQNANNTIVQGGADDDKITIASSANAVGSGLIAAQIDAGAGNDLISLVAGDNFINGNTGTDTLQLLGGTGFYGVVSIEKFI